MTLTPRRVCGVSESEFSVRRVFMFLVWFAHLDPQTHTSKTQDTTLSARCEIRTPRAPMLPRSPAHAPDRSLPTHAHNATTRTTTSHENTRTKSRPPMLRLCRSTAQAKIPSNNHQTSPRRRSAPSPSAAAPPPVQRMPTAPPPRRPQEPSAAAAAAPRACRGPNVAAQLSEAPGWSTARA